jgi:adenosylcobinamide kinase/adenosylcobinamide-phosphate guanylyltransferase
MQPSDPHDLESPSDRRLVLVTGGARSGKSAYAETLAARLAVGRSVLYVATATAGDEEMRARIARHRAARPAGWVTVEEPRDPAAALAAHPAVRAAGVVLVDCLTLLVANALTGGPEALGETETVDGAGTEATADEGERRATAAVEGLLAAYRAGTASFIAVTNEVGMGLVPPYPLGRRYRDVLGRLNARVAADADAVLLLVAGLPVELKALARSWEERAARVLGPLTPRADADPGRQRG